jgi:Flp pilus assembly protein TadG
VTSVRKVLNAERGTSTVEFLVVLPVLLFIMLGTVELSRAFMTMNLVTTAAREGARWGAVSAPDQVVSAATSRISEILLAGGISCGGCANVTCSSGCDPAADSRVQADVTVTFQTIVPLFLPMLTSINLNQTASMRYEGNPTPPSP